MLIDGFSFACAVDQSCYCVQVTRAASLLLCFVVAACNGSQEAPADGGSDVEADGLDGGADGDVAVGDADGDQEQEPLGPDCHYATERSGVREGQVLHPVHLWTCDAELTTIPELSCGNEAIIIHLSTTWCSICEYATALVLREVMAELEGEPVAFVELLLEEDYNVPAGPEACHLWSERFEPNAPTYVPPNGVMSDQLYAIADVAAPPVTFLLDETGEIRWRSNVVLADRMEAEAERLLAHTREILDEE